MTTTPAPCAPQDKAMPKRAAATRGRRLFWYVVHVGFGCLLLALVLAGALVVILGVGMNLPFWVKNNLAAGISNGLSGYALRFEGMSLRFEHDLVPRLVLRGVAIARSDGTPLANLSALEVTVVPRPLMRGEVQLATVLLDGGQLLLRRRASGDFALALGGGASAGSVDEQQNMTTLTHQIETIFSRPEFTALREVTVKNLSLRYEDARAGRAWTADGGQIRLTRDGQRLDLRGNVTVLGARDYATTLEVSYGGLIGSPATELSLKFDDMPAGDMSGQLPALTWLAALDAPISGALRATVDAEGVLGPLSATLQIGAGVIQPTPATDPISFNSARSYFTYDPVAQEIVFSELSVDSSWGSAQAEGKARLVGMDAGWPRELQAQLRIGEIVTNPAGVYSAPVTFEGVSMDLRLQPDPFVLSIGEIRLRDQGQQLIVSGEVRGQSDGWDLALDGALDEMAPDRILTLWPKVLKPKVRKWITDNVRHADLSNIQFALRARPDERPDFALEFDYKNLEAIYVKNVPPIIKASGHASIFDNWFVVHADRGEVIAAQGGRIDIAGTSFIIPDVRLKESPARAHLNTESTITAALSLLDSPPFRFMEKAGQPVTLADGRARLEGSLDFMLTERLLPDEVAFDVSGELRNVRSETLIKGRVLASDLLTVKSSKSHLEIGGKARVGAVPVSARWDMTLGRNPKGESRVRGEIEISERFVDEFDIGLPSGALSGAGVANIEIGFAKGQPAQFALTSDLAGLGLRIPQMNWALREAETGRLDVAGTLGEPPQIESIRLGGAGLTAQGRVRLDAKGAFERAEFSNVTIGEWLNAPVVLIGRGGTLTPRIELNGGTIDLRQISLESDVSARSGGGPIVLRLERLQISDGIALTEFQASLETTGGMSGTFSGKLNGVSPVTGLVMPMDGRSAFRIKAEDAGGVLAAAGLLKKARDGALDLVLTPAPEPGSFDGVLAIDQIRVKEAPALAALLNTISVVGLLEQLSGNGLHFGKVDARFRLTPDRLILLEGSAVGASVGISMDGYYTAANKILDMQGVVSPVYVLNAIGGVFTRPGEGLIGFSYTLKGPTSDPVVGVNPLSAMTPGFLREMFRRPAPTVQGGLPAAVSGQPDLVQEEADLTLRQGPDR